MSYGLGLIKQNPSQAEDFLKSDLFKTNLGHKEYNTLLNYASQMRLWQEHRDKERANQTELTKKRDSDVKCRQLYINYLQEKGNPEADLEAGYESGEIADLDYIKYKREVCKSQRTNQREEARLRRVAEMFR
jgi:hypothetical protein